MGEGWRTYEDLKLRAAVEFYGTDPEAWIKIRPYSLPRTIKAAQYRGRKLEERRRRPAKSVSKEDELVSIRKPTGWSDLPTIPFLEICRYLRYDQIYGLLTRVCRNYAWMLETNQVALKEVRLRAYTSASKLVMIAKRVSRCDSLVIYVHHDPSRSLWNKLLGDLFAKFETDLVQLRVETGNQKSVADFIGRCKRLKRLELHYRQHNQPWDWSTLPICPTITDLVFDESAMARENLIQTFQKFPAMKRLTHSETWPPAREENDLFSGTSKDDREARILYFEGPHLVPERFLTHVTEMVLTIPVMSILEKLIMVLPQLRFLEELTIRYSPFIFNRWDVDEISPRMVTLCHTLKKCKSLQKVKIVCMKTADNYEPNNIDEETALLLLELPTSVDHIRFKNFILRAKE